MILQQPLIQGDSDDDYYSYEDNNPQIERQQDNRQNSNIKQENNHNKNRNNINNNKSLINNNNESNNTNSIQQQQAESPIKRLKLSTNSQYTNNNNNNINDNINDNNNNNLQYNQIVPEILQLAIDKQKQQSSSFINNKTKQHTTSANYIDHQYKKEQLMIQKQQQQKQTMSDPNQRRFLDLYKHRIKPKKMQNQSNISKIEVQDRAGFYSVKQEEIAKQQKQKQIGNQQKQKQKLLLNQQIIQFGQGLEIISEKSQPTSLTIQDQQDKHISAEDILHYSINPSLRKNQKRQFLQQNKQSNIKTAQTTLITPPNISIPFNDRANINNKFNEKNKKLNKNKQRKLSLSICDSILSPRLQNYLNQNHINNKTLQVPKLTNFLNKSKRFINNHNQYQQHQKHQQKQHQKQQQQHQKQQQVYKSDTYPRCQLKSSRQSLIVKKQLQLTLANNLDKILFKYSGGHAMVLYNNKLKIKNNSPVSVQVKIQCTSPSHYDIRPISDIVLAPSQIMNFIIEMKLYMHDLDHVKMKHDLQRYHGDMFKICYWPSQYSPDIWYQEGQKILPVVIQDSQQQKIRNESLLKNQNDDQVKIAAGQRDIQMYRKMIQRNCLQIISIQEEINQLEKTRFWTGYFTKTTFILIALIGLSVGYWWG